jgi:hypothetical protein
MIATVPSVWPSTPCCAGDASARQVSASASAIKISLLFGNGMEVTIDANVLVRAAVCDDQVQADIAAQVFSEAALVAISLPCLCEFV